MATTKTKILSVRLPVDMAESIQDRCAVNGCSTSDFIKEKILDADVNTAIKKSSDVKMDEGTKTLLMGLGSGAVSYGVYKGIHSILENSDKEYKDDEVKLYSIAGAVVCGILAFLIAKGFFGKK